MYKYVLKRHDLVHRNGKTKEGELVEVRKEELNLLIFELTEFVKKIQSLIEENEIPATNKG